MITQSMKFVLMLLFFLVGSTARAEQKVVSLLEWSEYDGEDASTAKYYIDGQIVGAGWDGFDQVLKRVEHLQPGHSLVVAGDVRQKERGGYPSLPPPFHDRLHKLLATAEDRHVAVLLPERDGEVTLGWFGYNGDDRCDRELAEYVFAGEKVGRGAEGLARVMEKIAKLPRGTVVKVQDPHWDRRLSLPPYFPPYHRQRDRLFAVAAAAGVSVVESNTQPRDGERGRNPFPR